MFLEDVLVILLFARLLIITMLFRNGEDERTTGSHAVSAGWLGHMVPPSMQNKIFQDPEGTHVCL